MNENNGRELGWDDEVEDNSQQLIPEGEYNFTVTSFERGRFNGSDKMPSCPQASLKLLIDTPDGQMPLHCNLLLHTNLQWKLYQFFTSIGLKSHDGKITMNWGAVPGASGKCKITVRQYKKKDGGTGESNDVFFLEPAKPKKSYKPGAF